jgi:hypothetical protein
MTMCLPATPPPASDPGTQLLEDVVCQDATNFA